MKNIDDVKRRGRKLRTLLADCSHDISHSQSLEILAQLENHRDWNTYAATLRQDRALLPLPEGWTIGGDAAPFYDIGIAEPTTTDPFRYAVIADRSDPSYNGNGFATLMQSIDAAAYSGKRLRMRAALRAVNCTGTVTLWMRVDDASAGNMLAFDNMENREANGPLTGTTDWVEREIVLDVSIGAGLVNFGYYLRGAGRACAARFSLETVDEEIATTNTRPKRSPQPLNLRFS